MAERFFCLVTTTGQRKIAATMTGSPQVELTSMAFGDSNGAYYDPDQTQTALKREVYRTELSGLTQDKTNLNWFMAEAFIPDEVGNFTVREVGIYDADGDLFAIAKTAETYKPLMIDGSNKELFVRVIFQVSNADSVTLKIDPSIVLATKEFVHEAITNAFNQHPWKVTARVATTTNISLQGIQTIDGIRLVAGDRVLVKNQSNAAHNGIYLAATGTWFRPDDAKDESSLGTGLVIVIEEGNSQKQTLWRLSTPQPITVGTTALTFREILEDLVTTAYADSSYFGIKGYMDVVDLNTLTENGIYGYQANDNGNLPPEYEGSGGFLMVFRGHDSFSSYIYQTAYSLGKSVGNVRPIFYRRSSDGGSTWSVWKTHLLTEGGTMTGPLTLHGAPTSTLHAATKGYVDDAVKNTVPDLSGYAKTTDLSRYLPLAGGTVSGALLLTQSPSANNQAATKLYVDDTVKNNAPNLTGYATKTELANYALSSALNNYLALAGGTMAGSIRVGETTKFQGAAAALMYGITNTSNEAGYNLATWGGGNERLSLLSLKSGSPASTSSQASGAIGFNCIHDTDGLLKTNVASGAHLIEGTRSGGWVFRSTPSLDGGAAITTSNMATTLVVGPQINVYSPVNTYGSLNVNSDLIVSAAGIVNLGSSTGGTTVARTASIVSGGTINIGVATSAAIACNGATVSAGQAAAIACTGAIANGQNAIVLGSASNPTASGSQSAILGGAGGNATGTSSVVIGSNIATTSATNATVIGSVRSEAHVTQSAVIASTSSTIPANTDSSCAVVIGAQSSTSTGARSGVYSSQNCTASGSRSAVFGSYYSTASGVGNVLLGSMATLLSENYAIGYGYGSGTTPLAANLKFKVKATGEIQAAGAFNGNATLTDYAEFFENEAPGVISLGSIVALSGRYVRLANADDSDILGVVTGSYVDDETGSYFTGTALIKAGDSPFSWSKRYLTGEFGQILYETIPDPHWPEANSVIEYEYDDEGNIINTIKKTPENDPPLITVPIENPEFNPEEDNIPRSHRPEEWTCVGLMGQVHVRVDETVEVGRYVKADKKGHGTLSLDKTTLRCMDVLQPFDEDKGYGVALCLLK